MTSGYGKPSQCEAQNVGVIFTAEVTAKKTIIKKKIKRNPGKESAKCFISCPLVVFCLSPKRSPGGYNWIYCPWNNKSCLKFYVFPLLALPASKVGEERVQRGCLVKESCCNQWHHAPIIPLQQAKASSSPSTPNPLQRGPPSPGGSGPPNPCRPCCHVCRDSHARVSEPSDEGEAGVSGWVWLSVSQQRSG